jgi:AbrB family looped-hinge helix DNA binding protein
VESSARVTAKGQVTIPKAVRDALGIQAGDALVFRVEGQRAVMAPTGDLLELAGSVTVPAGRRGTSWDDVRRHTHRVRNRTRR